MLSAFHQLVTTDPATDFIAAQATNVLSDTVDLPLPQKTPYWFIRGIQITSVQALAWELWFFSRAANFQGTMTTAYFLSAYQFAVPVVGPPATIGWPVAYAGTSPDDDLVRYTVSNLLLPYVDLDFPSATDGATPLLHCRLVNRSSTTKQADTLGAIQVTFFVSPQGAQV